LATKIKERSPLTADNPNFIKALSGNTFIKKFDLVKGIHGYIDTVF
jgi:hypothetical protein